MKRLADVPIRRKLSFVMLVTTGLALLVATAAFISYEWVSARRSMSEDLQTLARIVGSNATAALTFDDPVTAKELLDSLAANPVVMGACLYEPGGSLFSEYSRADRGVACPESAGVDRLVFDSVSLVYAGPVELDSERIGTLLLFEDLAPLWGRLRSYAGIAAVVMLFSMLAASGLAAVLQRVISEPVLSLSQTVRSVSETRDFSLRAESHGSDEVGTLIAGFNDMLAEIQGTSRELQRAHDELEARVEERTRELQLEILERRRAEQHLKDSADKLERSNRDLQDFAYVASHDLQEPLRKIQAFGDRLTKTSADELGERGLDYLDRMQSAAGRMRTLITDVLAFSRVTTRARPFEPVDLEALVDEVLQDLEFRVADTKATIQRQVLDTIDADLSQLRQVLQNLIGNAMKFSKPGEPPVIHICGKGAENDDPRLGAMYELTVADEGIGFEPKHADRIFGMFSRLHGRGEYEGTGVGLAICRKIVERHNGEIVAVGEPGSGSRFTLRLPRAQPREEESEESA